MFSKAELQIIQGALIEAEIVHIKESYDQDVQHAATARRMIREIKDVARKVEREIAKLPSYTLTHTAADWLVIMYAIDQFTGELYSKLRLFIWSKITGVDMDATVTIPMGEEAYSVLAKLTPQRG